MAAMIVVAMLGLAYASVPLYRLFCQVTGFGGTTQVASAAPTKTIDRVIRVRFDANVSQTFPWGFSPEQTTVETRIGEQQLVFYRAYNDTDKPLVGTSTFNVTPAIAGQYFNKIQCFCFEEQVLMPGESVDMPVVFFVDPAIEDDWQSRRVSEITLSYTFYQVDDPSASALRTIEKKQAQPVVAKTAMATQREIEQPATTH